jgi:hypothetical protein
MAKYKDKIITFPLFNTCYPQNLVRYLARSFNKMIDLFDIMIFGWKGDKIFKHGII